MAWFQFDMTKVNFQINSKEGTIDIQPKDIITLPCIVTGYGIPGVTEYKIKVDLAQHVIDLVKKLKAHPGEKNESSDS